MAENSLLSISDMAEFFDVVEHSIKMDMQYLKFEIDTLPNKRNLQLLRSLLEKKRRLH